ncbi:MAG: OsmC family protein [Proteobacteria bacterium]|nr:OsmC family protein [Pseudomonadota bacterium]
MTEVNVQYLGDLRTQCTHVESGSQILTDAPKDNQGLGREFSPTDLIAASIGSCTLTIMAIAANRLSVDLTGTQAKVIKEMQAAPRRIAKLTVTVSCPHQFEESIVQKLIAAAHQCPVLKSLLPEIEVKIDFHWGV